MNYEIAPFYVINAPLPKYLSNQHVATSKNFITMRDLLLLKYKAKCDDNGMESATNFIEEYLRKCALAAINTMDTIILCLKSY